MMLSEIRSTGYAPSGRDKTIIITVENALKFKPLLSKEHSWGLSCVYRRAQKWLENKQMRSL
jgi:hypothetical protein